MGTTHTPVELPAGARLADERFGGAARPFGS
jgi:hypothetical protein